MGKPSPPKPPDPTEVAGAQTAQNVGTATANAYLGNVNQRTPYGSLNYEQTGSYNYTDPATGATYEIPQFTATQSYNPQQQRIVDRNMQTQNVMSKTALEQSQDMRKLLNEDLDFGDMPAGGSAANIGDPNYMNVDPNLLGGIQSSYIDDFSADRQRVEDELMGKLDERFTQDRAAMETRLTQQGLQPGTEAWDRAMAAQNDAEQEARTQAILNAGEEQSRLAALSYQQAAFGNQAQGQQYGQGMNALQYQNTLADKGFQNDVTMFNVQNQERERAIQEALAQRNQQINEVSALSSGAQVMQPQFTSTQGVQMPTVDQAGIIGNNYNQQMANYNAQMGAYNNLTGGLFGLGAAGIGMF